ncbi:lipoprotein [Spiroplasma ixodetis]
MKKLLNILSSIILTSITSASAISCGKPDFPIVKKWYFR